MRRVSKSEHARVSLTLNGRKTSGHAEPRMLLSDFLRHVLGATVWAITKQMSINAVMFEYLDADLWSTPP